MNVTQFLAVNGTHENRGKAEWSAPDSSISKYLERQGLLNIAESAMLPYDWSTNLNFLPGHHEDWEAGGKALFFYLVPPLKPQYAWPPRETVVVTHSHGLQVALWAAKLGLKIDRLLDIAGPVREDMRIVAEAARPNIRRWLHVHSDTSDRWQWLGEMFDGKLGIVRKHPLADVNVGVPKVGHSGLITDPKYFGLWVTDGLVDFLKAA